MTLVLLLRPLGDPGPSDPALHVLSDTAVLVAAEDVPVELALRVESDTEVRIAATAENPPPVPPRYRRGPLPWMVFGGVEIGNEARVFAYLANPYSLDLNPTGVVGVSPNWRLANPDRSCPVLRTDGAGNPVEFRRPDLLSVSSGDPAPWYEPQVPESAEFLGVLIRRVTGLDSPITRAKSARGTGGSSLGPQVMGERELTVEATLIGTSCPGLEYGRRWLAHVLSNDLCDTCEAYQLELRTTCPPADRPDVGLVNLYDVALLDGPRAVTDGDDGLDCCDLVDVEWRMVAADPWVYGCPVELLPLTPAENLPAVVGGNVGQAAATIDPPEPFGEVGAIVSVFTGTTPGFFTILAHDLADGGLCPPALDQPCLRIRFENVPADRTVVVDGARRRLRLRDGSGDETDATPYVRISDGEAFAWPVFSGCAQMCVSVDLDLDFDPNGVNPPTTPPGAAVAISAQARFLT